MNARKKITDQDPQLDFIEASLAGTLKPVRPRQDFVHRLRERIHLPHREDIVFRLRDWERLLLIFGSVLSGMVVLLTIARALFHLFGRRNV